MSTMKSRDWTSIAPRSSRLLALLAAAVAGSRSAHAQELLWQVDGTASEELGETLATLSDLDGDGRREVIAGAPTGELVRVFSGATGSKLWEWVHTPPSHHFGHAVGDAGDVNGDGVPDVIVGAPGDFSTENGDAYVFSGADGSTLYALSGAHLGDMFGDAVCGLGDVDGDGLGDFAIGAPTVILFGSGYDRVEVHSGATGQLLYSVFPKVLGDNLGAALALLDDLDGDGVRDFAAGAIVGKYVDVVSSRTGALLFSIQSPGTDFDVFGASLSAVGDFDGDGFGDLLVGSPLRDVGKNTAAGAAEVFSSISGLLLQQHLGTKKTLMTGVSVASAGDSNGDGAPDLLVGSQTGYADLYSGSSGGLLYRFKADPSLLNGLGVAGGEDFAGDGLAGVVVGSPLRGTGHPGHVEVRRGNDLYLDSEPFQPAAGVNLKLVLGEGIPGNLALVALTAVNGAPLFMSLAIAPLDANGQLTLQGPVPAGLSGTSADFLGLAISGGGKLAVSATETVLFQ
jgi:hypothetical protein